MKEPHPLSPHYNSICFRYYTRAKSNLQPFTFQRTQIIHKRCIKEQSIVPKAPGVSLLYIVHKTRYGASTFTTHIIIYIIIEFTTSSTLTAIDNVKQTDGDKDAAGTKDNGMCRASCKRLILVFLHNIIYTQRTPRFVHYDIVNC